MLMACGLWHLLAFGTRPMNSMKSKAPAAHFCRALDARLSQSAFQTIVHGDAKLANFLFTEDLRRWRPSIFACRPWLRDEDVLILWEAACMTTSVNQEAAILDFTSERKEILAASEIDFRNWKLSGGPCTQGLGRFSAVHDGWSQARLHGYSRK